VISLIIKLGILIGLVYYLLSRGISSKKRFASWHMFIDYSHCYFTLSVEGKPFNPWALLPNTVLSLNSLNEIEFFLFYLRNYRNIYPSGSILVKRYKSEITLIVKNGYLVDPAL